MKYLKEYKIFEYLANEKLVKSTINIYLRQILSLSKNSNFREEYSDKRTFKFLINTEEPHGKKTLQLLNKCKNQLMKSGTFMNWSEHKSHKMKLSDDGDLNFDIEEDKPLDLSYHIYVKDVMSNRKKPPKYLYHATRFKHHESIMKNGLEIRNNENHWDTPELNNPGAIFTSSDIDFWTSHFYENDIIAIYKIDTTKIKNSWFADFNLINRDEGKNSYLTYDPIPSSALTLMTNENGKIDHQKQINR